MKLLPFLFSQVLLYCFITGCSVSTKNQTGGNASMPFKIEILKRSRETVLTQTLPWEEQMMGYFKVLKMGPANWQMWYSSWDNKRKDDYSGYLVYAHSTDGVHWVKEIPGKENNILKGTGHPQKDGAVEQDVFMEPGAAYPYRMIYTAKDNAGNGKEKTYVEESKDGLRWVNKKVLWNEKHDSQFSVIRRNSRYYIYLRYWEVRNKVRYRTIGLAITDTNWNTLQEPKNIFTASDESGFPHLYNPGASKVNKDLDILFPTFFNEKTNAIKFGLAYVFKGKPVLTDVDFTRDLLEGENANWGIVSPGLIPAGKNTYWIYYYATNMVHSDYDQSGRRFKYYRIKVRIKPT